MQMLHLLGPQIEMQLSEPILDSIRNGWDQQSARLPRWLVGATAGGGEALGSAVCLCEESTWSMHSAVLGSRTRPGNCHLERKISI